MSATDVENLRKAWNAQNPHDPIQSGNTAEVRRALSERTKGECDGEACWARMAFVKRHAGAKESLTKAHRPLAPREWKANPEEWLTSDDIEAVMKQYEREYAHFVFLGASPIDFDAQSTDEPGRCVWEKLCGLSLRNEKRRGKTNIAVIFNADPHYKEGSHWMAMFVDLEKAYILYFDSTGDPMPREVKRLVKRLQDQGKAMGIPLRLVVSRAKHQRRNTECGIYGLYAISQLLQGKRTPESLTRGRISDDAMFKFRKHFFNLPE